jgi:hypothetical protein
MNPRAKPDTFPCPHCGANVSVRARFCRECGSDAESGWSDEADLGLADIPSGYGRDNEFDYNEYIDRENSWLSRDIFGRTPKQWLLAVIVAIIVLALLGQMFFV